MKTNLKFILIALFAVALTSCSPEDGMDGEQGPAGIDGNANVESYSFAVNRADWNATSPYGDGNIFRDYPISPNLIGGNDINTIIGEGGAVLIYVNFLDVGDFLLMPVSFSYAGVGVKLTASLNRGVLFISKTTNGWDNLSIAINEIPETINYRIVLVPKEAQGKLYKDGNPMNLSNFNTVANLFNLNMESN